MLEEIAALRHMVRTRQTQEIIYFKFWGNIVKRVDDFRMFIAVYNDITYKRQASRYKAWYLLTSEVDKKTPAFFLVKKQDAYLDRVTSIEANDEGKDVQDSVESMVRNMPD